MLGCWDAGMVGLKKGNGEGKGQMAEGRFSLRFRL